MRDLTLAQLNGPAQKSKKNEKTEKVIINAFEKVSHRWPYSSETAFAVVDGLFKKVRVACSALCSNSG